MPDWAGKIRDWAAGGCSSSDAWLVLQTLPGMTPERLERLGEAFGAPERALAAPGAEFGRLAGRRAREVIEREAPADIAARLRRELRGAGTSVLVRGEAGYPAPLETIFGPPGALFAEGELLPRDSLSIAVVGMRRPTSYGRRVAREIAGTLAAGGFTVVSGLAVGIDGEAHRAALDAGGRTVAVLGCGLDHQYPAEHSDLRERIAAGGAVVTEFPRQVPPRPQNFPRRNRLISGLSLATVVIEAAQRSGALITARLALEQGREVMAVPGPVHAGRSAGCHRLLKEGAHLVESAEDIVAALPDYVREALAAGGKDPRPPGGAQAPAGPATPPENADGAASLSGEESALLGLLEEGENSVEGLTRAGGLRPEVVSSVLLHLELRGLVRPTGGGRYERA